MEQLNIKNIFFDFDGVIAESVQVKDKAFYNMYLPYGEEIAQKVLQYHHQHGGVSRYDKFRYWHKEYLGTEINEHKVAELAALFSRLVVQGVINSPEVKGATDFLKRYHTQFRFWVITGTPSPEIANIAKARNIDQYFVGLHGSPEKKSHWTEYLLDKYDLKREETLFLGDATTDYEAAQHSKLHFALRAYAANADLFADYEGWQFSDFTELEKLLAGMKTLEMV